MNNDLKFSEYPRKKVNFVTPKAQSAEELERDKALIQALTDPENQPSQFGTVPLSWYENLENKIERIRFNVNSVIDSLDGSYEKHVIRKQLQAALDDDALKQEVK